MSAHDGAAYASYEHQWLTAQPEQALVALFLPPPLRRRAAAFGTLVHELGASAFRAREPQAAAAKLAWWQQELSAAPHGSARHPITQQLFDEADVRALDAALWPGLAAGALAQLEAGGAGTLQELRAQLGAFFAPVARAEAALLAGGDSDAHAAATLWSAAHLLQELPQLRPDKAQLPLPLELFARHGLARADLAQATPQRAALMRDWLAQLAALHAAARAGAQALPLRVRARLDARRIAAAQRAADPLGWLQTHPRTGGLRALWDTWREARAAALR